MPPKAKFTEGKKLLHLSFRFFIVLLLRLTNAIYAQNIYFSRSMMIVHFDGTHFLWLGEKVLCFHGPLIYEAKALKWQAQGKDKQIKYFIHYAGWNKK